MTEQELIGLTLTRAVELIEAKELSPIELTRACIDRIARLDSRLRTYITLLAEDAIAQAHKAERTLTHGEGVWPLHGVPLALKDTFAMKGVLTTAGSKVLGDYVPDYDSTVVEQLRDAGAIFLGTLNMHEFACGATTANPHYGSVRNPWNRDHIPGGSSGGSGAAVAASLCLGSVGTDAGGSVRLPAALCGIVGLKPTFGRISRYGTLPLTQTLDHNGPMAKTVADAALLLQVMAGPDPRDPACSPQPVPMYAQALNGEVKGLRIGMPQEYFADGMDAEVRVAVLAAIQLLEKDGAIIKEVSLPHAQYGPAAFVGLALPEASATHAKDLKARPQDYGQETREQLYMGMLIPSQRYIQAQQVRTVIIQDQLKALEQVDVLVLPTSAIPAPELGQRHVTIGNRTVNVTAALSRLTLPFDLSGLPAISIPCGFTSKGLPIGLQIAGRAFDEETVLRVAHAYEQRTEWHLRQPEL